MMTLLVRSMTEGSAVQLDGGDWSPLGNSVGSPQMV